METIADTFEVVGKVLIAYTAIRVHERVRKEHKIDSAVFKTMHREQHLGILGIAFIIVGYIVRMVGRFAI